MKLNWYKVLGVVVGILGLALIVVNEYVVTGVFLFCIALFLIFGDAEKLFRFFLKEDKSGK